MSPFWVVQQAANGGLLRDPIVGGVRKSAQSLRRSLDFSMEAQSA